VEDGFQEVDGFGGHVGAAVCGKDAEGEFFEEGFIVFGVFLEGLKSLLCVVFYLVVVGDDVRFHLKLASSTVTSAVALFFEKDWLMVEHRSRP